MLKKVTVVNENNNLEEVVINTALIHSVNKHHKLEHITTVHYDSRIYNIKEPIDAFIERINTGMEEETLNRFKSLESNLELLRQAVTEAVTTSVLNASLENFADQINAALNDFNSRIPPKA